MNDTPETDKKLNLFPWIDFARIATDEMIQSKRKLREVKQQLDDVERERNEWRKCAEKLAAIIGAPDEEQSLLWKTDDEINEAWSAFNKLKEGTK